MVDASAPFFVRHKHPAVINWSKAPAHEIHPAGKVKKKVNRKVRESFAEYIRRVRRIGYNALSIDEAGFLIPLTDQRADPEKQDESAESEFSGRDSDLTLPWNPELNRSIRRYRKHYRRLFEMALSEGMKPYLTADVWYRIHSRKGLKGKALFAHIGKLIGRLLDDFGELEGIIFRIGESDGVDVDSPFRSQLTLKRPREVRDFIDLVLPEFEARQRTMILRTWTLGAGPVGDLLWNRKTLEKCIPDSARISGSFLLSYKFSQSDFLRHQKLNPYALNSPVPYILELQARREYEGFGEFPCFVGFDYADYARQLRTVDKLKGIHVWCQTGGWSRFRNFSFLKKRSYWNELNTRIILELFRNAGDLDRALIRSSSYGNSDLTRLKRFLQLSDDLIKNVLYIPGFARHELYMNRSRVPSLIHVLWDRIVVSPFLAAVIRTFCRDAVAEDVAARSAMMGLEEMQSLKKSLKLPYDANFHTDTFQLFYLARKLLLGGGAEGGILKALQEKRDEYYESYKRTYQLQLTYSAHSSRLASSLFALLIRLLIRRGPKYRWRDYLLFNPFSKLLVLAVLPLLKSQLPDTVDEQATPLKELI